jgi:hypothetical protein
VFPQPKIPHASGTVISRSCRAAGASGGFGLVPISVVLGYGEFAGPQIGLSGQLRPDLSHACVRSFGHDEIRRSGEIQGKSDTKTGFGDILRDSVNETVVAFHLPEAEIGAKMTPYWEG